MKEFPILVSLDGEKKVIKSLDEMPQDTNLKLLETNFKPKTIYVRVAYATKEALSTHTIDFSYGGREANRTLEVIKQEGKEFAQFAYDNCGSEWLRAVYQELQRLYQNR